MEGRRRSSGQTTGYSSSNSRVWTAASPSKNPASTKRSFLARIADALFGYDFFISYAWKDAGQYAGILANKLKEQGFDCFLDREGFALGDRWRTIGQLALRKTSRLILLGTPEALHSEPVRTELAIYSSRKNGRVIPIDFDRTIVSSIANGDAIAQFLEDDVVRLQESKARLSTGPSDQVLTELRRSFDLERQATKRVRALKITAGILLVLLLAAILAAFLAVHEKNLAETNLADYRRMADIKVLSEDIESANDLWPAYPDKINPMEMWLQRIDPLVHRLETHRATLAQLRKRGTRINKRVSPNSKRLSPQGSNDPEETSDRWVFASAEDQWQHDTLSELVRTLQNFADPDPRIGTVANVRERLDFAQNVQHNTIERYKNEWNKAINSISNPSECPAYSGLQIKPQIGLVPIGPDPNSGLWEFANFQTGKIPQRDSDGNLIMTDDMALVLVLIPGGTFQMGAVKPSAVNKVGSPNVDQDAYADEGPVRLLTLEPFFLSKFEMTQGQWLHFTGNNPSVYGPGSPLTAGDRPLLHPVENVSWNECAQVLFQLGLVLPTEAEVEYATRAGTTTVWWTGNSRESLRGAANLADQSALRAGMSWPDAEDWPDLDDGHPVHAPVGSYRPNPFGLYDVHGNVWEWCRDVYAPYTAPVKQGDGERQTPDTGLRVTRNGDFMSKAAYARSAFRDKLAPDYRYFNLGVRPARVLER